MKSSDSKLKFKTFIHDARFILSSSKSKKFSHLCVPELAFDLQLLNLSPLYRRSREMYLDLNGTFCPRVCSTMRGLSTHDLFKNEIDYPPLLSELKWFIESGTIYTDAELELAALTRFSEISIFHEQNHRIIWPLLPPCPDTKAEIHRYLNFAEALVVTLDMALGDQLGRKISEACERLKAIYHPAGPNSILKISKKVQRLYLLGIFTATYFLLETMHSDDVIKAVNYVLPRQGRINQLAVARALDLSELFRHVTNPEWQELNWKKSSTKLKHIHKQSSSEILRLPADSLDLDEELNIVEGILTNFGL